MEMVVSYNGKKQTLPVVSYGVLIGYRQDGVFEIQPGGYSILPDHNKITTSMIYFAFKTPDPRSLGAAFRNLCDITTSMNTLDD
jgi:hypothetical protein